MATETAKFALSLEDDISASADSAEDSLKSLQSQIDRDTKALAQMQKAMRQMQAASSVDISAYRKLKSEIDTTKNSIGKARASFVNLGGDFNKLGRKAKGAKIAPKIESPKGLGDMLSAANSLPGPLGKVSSSIGGVQGKVAGLTGAMGMTVAVTVGAVAVFAALVAILGAVAVATAKATQKLLAYAAAQADAMRAERLRLQGLGTLRRWMRLTGKDADQMSDSINRVSATVPLARGEIASMGQELHRIGIRGRAAEHALEALATAQAVQGEFGRRRLMLLVRQAGHSERAMADLARRVRKELGGTAAAQMRGLSMISTKLRESFRALFTGDDMRRGLESLLSGLFRLSQLISQNTFSGRALRTILGTVLGTFMGDLADTTPRLEYLFNELVIAALRVAIGFFRIKNAIERAFGNQILARFLAANVTTERLHIALIALGIVAVTLAAGVALLGLVVIGLLTPLIIMATVMYEGYLAAQRLGQSIAWLIAVFTANAANWRALGGAMIDGIISGLNDGVARLTDAVRSVATAAMNEFRSVLRIGSPSRVFADLGVTIPQGIAAGIEQGSGEAQAAVTTMVTATGNEAAGAGQGEGSRSYTIENLTIQVGAGAGDRDTAQSVADAIRNLFETDLAAEPVT